MVTTTSDPSETARVGEQLAAELTPGTVLAIQGDLGAGKTCFVQGLARGLGFRGAVTSPTFTLIHEYRGGRLPLYHIDLYRLTDPQQAVAIGVEEYFDAGGVTVIEWPERIASLLPAHTRWVEIAITGPTTRQLTIR
ncbi:MAG: tRNA (adenosine(37)-N6)-threonylcarbamoyltransferase complex ATPase subunit type 1 TsaE [Verrucomicrobiae bacterium]|nr:tRNA (adenosine(37)-N6)-threonylcarbamoyltransferase complex ATPase subunit type 1 TsaE [Verrucomicrobiae bacterium]